VKGALLLNIIVRERSSIFELLAREDQALLVRWDALLILNLRLDVINGVGRLNLQRDGLAGESFDENLHSAAETKDQVKGGLLLDVIIRKCTAVLELLAGEDKTLLIRRDTLLVLDLCLHVVDGVRGLNLQRDRLSGKSLHENLHTAAQTQDEMESGLLLDIIIRKGPTILELLAGEDEALLVGWDSFLILNFGLHIIDRVRRLDLQCNGLSGKGLHKDLHATAKTEDEMQGGLLLDVVVGQSPAILELLASEDKTLLVGWDALLVLNLGFNVIDGVRGLHLEGDGLASESLHEDLHCR